jgi:hypothetical protein
VPGAAPLILVITAPDRCRATGIWSPERFSVSCYYQLQARSWLSSRLKAGTSDDFVQFLGGLGHLVQLSCNRVEIPGRRSTRAIQIIDADRTLKRLDGANRSYGLDPCRYALCAFRWDRPNLLRHRPSRSRFRNFPLPICGEHVDNDTHRDQSAPAGFISGFPVHTSGGLANSTDAEPPLWRIRELFICAKPLRHLASCQRERRNHQLIYEDPYDRSMERAQPERSPRSALVTLTFRPSS